jgi:simple sugar transport system ATP-binding protein
VLEISDRIAIMYRGRIVDIVDGRTANKEAVGLLMATGGKSEHAGAAEAGS